MKIDELIAAAGKALEDNDTGKTRNIAEQLRSELSIAPDSVQTLRGYANLGGILIDLGSWLSEEATVEEGTRYALEAISRLPNKEVSVSDYYNAANGYAALWQLRWQECYREGRVDESQQHAKEFYRKALGLARKQRSPDTSLRCQLLVNYANCLDRVWRRFEAVSWDEEALRINPSMGEALGNKGITLLGLAPLVHGHRHGFYLEAHRLLRMAIDSPIHERARETFRAYFARAEGVLNAHGRMVAEKVKRVAPGSRFERYLRVFCDKYDLYLTPTTVIGERNQRVLEDPMFISRMIAPLEDRERFYRHITFLDQIKQDYVMARYLLVQSQFRSGTIDAVDAGVSLFDSGDYSVQGAYVQMLKTAFRLTVDVLDKVAYFVREYFDVTSVQDDRVSFRNVFSTKEARLVLRPELQQAKNPYLFALFDLALDLGKEGDFKGVYPRRNSLTHRFLVIEEYGSRKREGIETVELSGFRDECVFAMQLARAAVIYLMLMVDVREAGDEIASAAYAPIVGIPVPERLMWKPR